MELTNVILEYLKVLAWSAVAITFLIIFRSRIEDILRILADRLRKAQTLKGSVVSDELEAIKQESLRKARESGKIEDMEKAASVWKLTAESAKQYMDTNNQRRILRYEGFKSWATLIVPLLTLGTLAVTIWLQTNQLTATREANEDTQWREVIKIVSGAQPNIISGFAITTSLKPFLESTRYGSQALELAQLLLGRIAAVDAFEDLFNSSIGEPSWDNLPRIVQVARQLYASFLETDSLVDEIKQQEQDLKNQLRQIEPGTLQIPAREPPQFPRNRFPINAISF